MKKVLLVNTNTEIIPYPVPPLGLCMLASALEGSYETEVWDGVFRGVSGLAERVTQWQPDYIGFSIRNIDDTVMDSPRYYAAGILDQFIRPLRHLTSAPFILGGSGFSIFPGELMKLSGADYGIIGEGEDMFLELLRQLDQGEQEPHLPNLLRKNQARQELINISGATLLTGSYPEIDRRIDFSPYLRRGAYSVQTKRGCAHSCIYCTYPLVEGKCFRVREPEDVAEEISQVYERIGTVMVEFVDSTFNDPAGHAEAICRAILKTKARMKFRTMGINPKHTSRELFLLMNEAGFVQVDATPDTASPRIIRNMGKGFQAGDIIRTAELIREADLPTMWFFLFGGPGENEETVRETLTFIERYVNPDDLAYLSAGLRIYPGTPLHRIALEEGKIRPGDSLLFPPVFYLSDQVPKERILEMIRDASMHLPNCIPATESAPSKEMLEEAGALRSREGLTEPMFRTLLKIRKKRFLSEKS